jgi:hypothetical protein
VADAKRTVVIPLKCEHCGKGITVECEHHSGTGITNFYVDCPQCGKRHDRPLPGRVVDVRPRLESTGESE